MMVETYLRRGQRAAQRMLLDPRVRCWASAAAWGGGGFLLSAAGVGNYAQPVVMGMICAGTGWRAVLMTLGAMVGYPTFWGMAGLPGVVWSAAAGLLTVLVGDREESREQPYMIPAIAAFLTGVTELVFWFFLKDETPLVIRLVRVMLTGLTAMLFLQASWCRDPITDWLSGGVVVLAVARVSVGPMGLGSTLAGLLAVTGAFPASALAGLGLDLAQVTKVPMTAVLCLSWFLRMLPWDKHWQQCAAPGAAYLLVAAVCGIWDPGPVPGLMVGSALGVLLPPQPSLPRRRGESGAAQVRLELGAEAMGTIRQLLTELEPPPIDEAALLEKAVSRACGRCSARKGCQARASFTASVLYDPLEADCRKQGRLIPELRRAQEQLRLLKADRQRRWEYRTALIQQYEFMGDYLRTMADRLPRRAANPKAEFRVEVGARSRGKERANGDSCIAFPGMECRYYILLCDGMGTGLGAAQEGHSAAQLLRQLLAAGFPAEHALSTINSLLVLRGSAGAVTVDLAEIHLDTGLAEVYKWGAAPSWVLSRAGAEKIGTATPPPGISVNKTHQEREKLSLRRGEVLILLSDGVDGEEFLRRCDLSPDLPPGELAAKLLERGCGSGEDDATVTAIKLRPTSLATS